MIGALARRAGDAIRPLLREPALMIGLGMLGFLLLLAISGPWLVNADLARVGSLRPRLPPSLTSLLGTDSQGRDVLAALVLATPQTLKIGLIAGFIGLALGAILGLSAGYFGGITDTVIRLAADVVMTIPGIAVLVLVATNVRTMNVNLMAIIVASLSWMYATRAIRAQTLSLRERPYVQIARLNGLTGVGLIVRELLPNLLPYLAASFVTAVSRAMLATIGLEALGLGPQNELTLGMMIYWAQYYGAILRGLWWWWLPPVVMIVIMFVGLLLTAIGLDRVVNARLWKSP
ncbi:MAG: ABC transporter permease [Proteobacteria bacterium]|nr:ABC transporter permease [Pseudomonadota bacterium]